MGIEVRCRRPLGLLALCPWRLVSLFAGGCLVPTSCAEPMAVGRPGANWTSGKITLQQAPAKADQSDGDVIRTLYQLSKDRMGSSILRLGNDDVADREVSHEPRHVVDAVPILTERKSPESLGADRTPAVLLSQREDHTGMHVAGIAAHRATVSRRRFSACPVRHERHSAR